MVFMDVHAAYKKVGTKYWTFLLLLVIVSGETVRTGSRGRVHSFPYLSEDPVGPTRTDEETCDHAKHAYLEGSGLCIEHT